MSATTSTEQAKRLSLAVAILRVGLGLFLLIWGLEKFVIPDQNAGIYEFFYSVTLSRPVIYLLGAVQCLIALAIILGAFRRWSYGLGLILHAASTVVTLRLIVDPWGLISGEAQHLFFAAVPVLTAFVALYLLRDWDEHSLDAKRAAG